MESENVSLSDIWNLRIVSSHVDYRLQVFPNNQVIPWLNKNSLPNNKNLRQPIQIQGSKKQKFSEFFASFLKSTANSEHFENKYDSHSLCISEIIDCEI